MQKDFHFYVTYALCRLVGHKDALKIAWANQFTDECTDAELYRQQTQSAILDTWMDPQIQFSVIIPFHFIPGDDPAHPWMVTKDSMRANNLIAQASNPFELGIALHCLQDTFSHENFSGWQETLNSCFEWYDLRAIVPNVGHAEMGITPDVVNYTWTDPRTGEIKDNAVRALEATEATLIALGGLERNDWLSLADALERIFRGKDYDRRKQLLREMANSPIRFSQITDDMYSSYGIDFAEAASNHLSRAVGLLGGLPR